MASGIAGKLVMLKLVFLVKLIADTVTAMFAVHVITIDAVRLLRLVMPNLYGDEQLRGRFTGDPNP